MCTIGCRRFSVPGILISGLICAVEPLTHIPVARELAPAGARSAPKPRHLGESGLLSKLDGAASQPSGSKLPRHRGGSTQ
ncbi:hypothetical protein FHJ31_20325 [Pseudomonas sp. Fig-3]|nr:hypothetical protein FHJ31_20325 [Pseudomonas sp. Fig-3]